MIKTFQSFICSYVKSIPKYQITNKIACLICHKMNSSNYNYVNRTNNSNFNNRNILLNSSNGFESVQRQWSDTELGRNYRLDFKKCPGYPFVLMTYNILAQTYIDYHQELYRNINPSFLRWEYRLDNLLKELHSSHPHILCMQEVQQDHFSAIKDGLKNLQYKAVYYKRTGDKSDGCAIFINRNIFHIQDRRNLNLFYDKEPLLGRDNIAILLKLSFRGNPNKSFVLANTHLLYNPKREDIRLAQLQRIFSTLKGFGQSKSNKPIPVILVGDFNFSPTSLLFEFVTKGGILWEGSLTNECHNELKPTSDCAEESKPKEASQYKKTVSSDKSQLIKHSMKLQSVLSRDQLSDRATTYHHKWIPVDHIFYTEETDSNLKLLSTYLPPEVKNCFPIPNGVLGSDHHFLAANFLFT